MSDFQTKEDAIDVAVLMNQAPAVTATIIDEAVLPAIETEKPVGPVTGKQEEVAHKADPSALSAWVDDLREYADDHRGNAKAAEILDRIASLDLDDLAEVARHHLKDDVSAEDEQTGIVNDFHADTALEGAALEVREPGAEAAAAAAVDADYLPVARKPFVDEYDGMPDGGSGGGGGGGGGLPTDDGGGGDGDATPAKPADKAPPPSLSSRVAKALGLKPKADKPDKPDKSESSDKPRDPKKRDGAD